MSEDITKTGQHDGSDAIRATMRGIEKVMTNGFKDIREAIKEIKDSMNTAQTDHETRIRKLEEWKGQASGVGRVIPLILSTVLALASLVVAILALKG